MKKFIRSALIGMLIFIPLGVLAQSSNTIAGFKLGSSEDEAAEILKDLKANGICYEVSAGYDFLSKNPVMSCNSNGMSADMLSVDFRKIGLEFDSKNGRLKIIEFWFGFPNNSTRNHFEALLKDMRQITSSEVEVSIQADKVGNETVFATAIGSTFNITLRHDNDFGLHMYFSGD